MSDMTSGYNVAENIYLQPQFNTLCGFTESEMIDLLNPLKTQQNNDWTVEEALATLRTFYNGYRFTEGTAESVYNPTLSLYFLKHLHSTGQYPQELLDDNLAMDRRKLTYIGQLLNGESVLLEALDSDTGITLTRLARRFGVEDMLRGKEGYNVMASLLYYFGILTFDDRTSFGETRLRIPNLIVRSMLLSIVQTQNELN